MAQDAEQIRKQLARYETTSTEPQPKPRAVAEDGGSVWDYKTPDDWKPEPRYVKPEPDHSTGFKVGDFWPVSRWTDGHLERQALPHPNYEGEAGDLISDEMEAAFDEKWRLWHFASMALEKCIRLHLAVREFPDHSSTRPNKEETKQDFAETWQWLKGLWNATPGMTEPTEKQLDTWADELRARYDAQAKQIGAAAK
jgi:hypothetical protein